MSDAAPPLRFQLGARTLAVIPRRLTRIALSLEQAVAGGVPTVPTTREGDGWFVTSLPEAAPFAPAGWLVRTRQRYQRYYVNLSAGEEAWRATLSAQTRSSLKRKVKKATAAGATIRAYRTPAELAMFHPLARAISRTTYQERLLDMGLPADAEDLAAQATLASDDRVRAWLLFVGEQPVAYLWCSAEGSAMRYDFVGHDPAFAALSPGAVLMDAALHDLFAERFAWFDFTEGESQQKRSLASGGVACRDVLLLRPTLANRAALAAVGGFDRAVDLAKRSGAAGMAKRLRR